jgi:DNA-binding MarR family transcriptional regulator
MALYAKDGQTVRELSENAEINSSIISKVIDNLLRLGGH